MIIMLYCTRKLLRQVFVQAATQGNVNHLAATADTQERLADLDQCLYQVHLHAVTIGIDPFNFRMRSVAILPWVNIIAPGEENAIQPGQEQIQIIIGDSKE